MSKELNPPLLSLFLHISSADCFHLKLAAANQDEAA